MRGYSRMSVRENRSGRHTKEWILETACRLFNEHGSQAVSTKRIAKEMGISPGNLYYHFKNKEEIIRALVQNAMQTFTDEWDNPQIPSLKRFLVIINKVMQLHDIGIPNSNFLIKRFTCSTVIKFGFATGWQSCFL